MPDSNVFLPLRVFFSSFSIGIHPFPDRQADGYDTEIPPGSGWIQEEQHGLKPGEILIRPAGPMQGP